MSNIEEAIELIRNGWTIPVSSVPDLRKILEEIEPAPKKICGAYCWPYTENNICVLEPHTTGPHKDPKGRPFI